MQNLLTPLQAYGAMLCFLENYYHKTLSDDLGSLLGDMQLCDDDQKTWDQAAWADWITVLDEKSSMATLDAFKAMMNFLNVYYERTLSVDIKFLLNEIQLKENEEVASMEWNNWVECVNKVINKK